MVEARIIEITHTTNNVLGVQAGYTRPSDARDYIKEVGMAGQPSDTGAKGMYLGVSTQGIDALAEAYRSNTGYNLLSSPKVLAVSGKPAEIITGSRLGYKVKTVTPSGMMEDVQFMDVGTKLSIKPIVKDDGTIIMEIHPEVSTGSIQNDLPQKDSTETTTTLSVKDGQSIVIGGLLRDYVQEVQIGPPVLMDIPFLGTLFRRTVTDTQKREIVVLISPKIVDVADIAQQASQFEALDQIRKKSDDFKVLDMAR
jgi:type II secretory pathway component GspD/PulD (secretin)